MIDRENLQNISQRDVVLCSGAGFEQVRTPETVEEDIARAIRIAVLERKPVVLNVPADFQWREVEEQPAVKPRSVSPQTVRPDPAALDVAAGLVASAARPIVVAGSGASRPDARAALLRLARRIGAPVATSLAARISSAVSPTISASSAPSPTKSDWTSSAGLTPSSRSVPR